MATTMVKGEKFVCECCGGTLVVEKPCTCEQKQEMVCACGEKMTAQQP